MNLQTEIAEARASALALRASARACSGGQGALKFRLMRAAESLDVVVGIAVRALDRIEELERQLTTTTACNSLTIAGGSTLDTEDLVLILRALDVLERLVQDELASKQQDAELIGTRSRLLIVCAKVSAMQVSS